jgi:hypothetical protein
MYFHEVKWLALSMLQMFGILVITGRLFRDDTRDLDQATSECNAAGNPQATRFAVYIFPMRSRFSTHIFPIAMRSRFATDIFPMRSRFSTSTDIFPIRYRHIPDAFPVDSLQTYSQCVPNELTYSRWILYRHIPNAFPIRYRHTL